MTDDPIKAEAEARHAAHVDHPTHRPLSEDYELVGLRGEEALAKRFGLTVDMVRRPNGDGGIDNVLTLDGKQYVVDVKCARKAFNLIVEVGKVKPQTVYVLAAYYDETDSAELVGWEWGSIVLKAPTKDFGYGIENHYIPRERLRKIEELEARTRITETHSCEVCDAPNVNWGYRRGPEVHWFCLKHREFGEKIRAVTPAENPGA